MFQTLAKIIIIVLFSSFPILLWGYGTTFLSHHIWNRARFFSGLVAGTISVSTIIVFEKYFEQDTLMQIFAVSWVFLTLSMIAYGLMAKGSLYIWGFLRKVVILHTILFIILLALSYALRRYIDIPLSGIALFSSMASYLLLAWLEEGVKHISTLGLTAREFRFTRTDFLLFTFFVALGFVFVENIIYFSRAWGWSLGSLVSLGIGRTLFATMIHVFASALCVMCWWRWLSYGVFSLRYILWVVLGFILATLIHTLYNSLMWGGHIIGVLVLFLAGYFSFTQWIMADES